MQAQRLKLRQQYLAEYLDLVHIFNKFRKCKRKRLFFLFVFKPILLMHIV